MKDLLSEIISYKKELELLRSENAALKNHEGLKGNQSSVSLEDKLLIHLNHEILTPLNGINGMANLLLKTELSDVQSEYVRIIQQSTDYLVNNVKKLFDDVDSNKDGEAFKSFTESETPARNNLPFDTGIRSGNKIALKNVKVLLAEDNEVNQYLACELLKSWGIVIEVANNGFEAIKLWEENDFDIILMDIQMPGMGGVEATNYIRSHNNKDKALIPIIALTANSLKGQREEYINKGLSDHLSKPFNDSDLYNKILHLLTSEKRDISQKIALNSAGTLFDYARLKRISQGNVAFENKLMNIFIETVPDSYSKLKKYWDEDDLQKMAEIAHKLKTTIFSMGIEQLKIPIKFLEEAGLKNSRSNETYNLMLTVFDTLSAIVKDFKSKTIN